MLRAASVPLLLLIQTGAKKQVSCYSEAKLECLSSRSLSEDESAGCKNPVLPRASAVFQGERLHFKIHKRLEMMKREGYDLACVNLP